MPLFFIRLAEPKTPRAASRRRKCYLPNGAAVVFHERSHFHFAAADADADASASATLRSPLASISRYRRRIRRSLRAAALTRCTYACRFGGADVNQKDASLSFAASVFSRRRSRSSRTFVTRDPFQAYRARARERRLMQLTFVHKIA
jgi:hypothetical protein